MSLFGVQPEHNLIIALLQKKQFEKAKFRITLYNSKCAKEVCQAVFSSLSVECWISLLKNKTFHDVIYADKLKEIMGVAERKLRILPKDHVQYEKWLDVMVCIAQNAQWCQALGYSYFLNFAAINARLVEYLVTTPEFIAHLNFNQIMSLCLQCPSQTENILNVIRVMKTNKDYATWAHDILDQYSSTDSGKMQQRERLIKLLKKQQEEMEELQIKFDRLELKTMAKTLPVYAPRYKLSSLPVDLSNEDDVIILTPSIIAKKKIFAAKSQ